MTLWILLSTLTVASLLNSCAVVQIKDEIIYGDKGSLGAHYVHTLSDEKGDIPKSQWDDLRFGMLCWSSTAYGDWKAVIEQECSLAKNCNYQIIKQFFDKMDLLKSEIQLR